MTLGTEFLDHQKGLKTSLFLFFWNRNIPCYVDHGFDTDNEPINNFDQECSESDDKSEDSESDVALSEIVSGDVVTVHPTDCINHAQEVTYLQVMFDPRQHSLLLLQLNEYLQEHFPSLELPKSSGWKLMDALDSFDFQVKVPEEIIPNIWFQGKRSQVRIDLKVPHWDSLLKVLKKGFGIPDSSHCLLYSCQNGIYEMVSLLSLIQDGAHYYLVNEDSLDLPTPLVKICDSKAALSIPSEEIAGKGQDIALLNVPATFCVETQASVSSEHDESYISAFPVPLVAAPIQFVTKELDISSSSTEIVEKCVKKRVYQSHRYISTSGGYEMKISRRERSASIMTIFDIASVGESFSDPASLMDDAISIVTKESNDFMEENANYVLDLDGSFFDAISRHHVECNQLSSDLISLIIPQPPLESTTGACLEATQNGKGALNGISDLNDSEVTLVSAGAALPQLNVVETNDDHSTPTSTEPKLLLKRPTARFDFVTKLKGKMSAIKKVNQSNRRILCYREV